MAYKFPKIDTVFLRSKIARRIFFLFVVCALLPVCTLAFVAFKNVSTEFKNQARQRLRQFGKTVGLGTYERLLVLERELSAFGLSEKTEGKKLQTSVTYDSTRRIRSLFKGVALAFDDGRSSQIIGKVTAFPHLTASQKDHLEKGGTLLTTLPVSGSNVSILMIKRIGLPKHSERSHLIGVIDPTYLWGKRGEDVVPPEGEIHIIDYTGQSERILLSTNPQALPLKELKSMVHAASSGNFRWENKGGRYLLAYWNIFMQHRFCTRQWTVVTSQSVEKILSPLHGFEETFTYLFLLTLLVVLFLSVSQIRKSLIPIEKLREGTIRIAKGDLEGRVEIRSGDELEELGDSFNRMTEDIKQSRDFLIQAELRTRLFLESQPASLYRRQPDDGYEITYVTKGVQAFGYSPNDFIENSDFWVERIHRNDRERVLKIFDRLHEMEDQTCEYRFRTADGQYRWILDYWRLNRDIKGTPKDLMGIWLDITQRKLAEEDRDKLAEQLLHAQKMEAIGTLAGGIAHDLNNILSGLVTYPELLLLDLPLDSPFREPLLTIKKSGEKATTIVQDMLTLARRGVATTSVVNLNDIITDYLESIECFDLKRFHPYVQFTTRFESNLFNILGSPVHLSKAIMNLASNAAESMPSGGNIIINTENRYIDKPIRKYEDVREGEYVVLSVSDTGTGISPEDQKRIFEPFYTKKTMGRSGTGLGMAIVWATVKDHLGYIDLESTEGKGTIFSIYYPVTRQDPVADASEAIIYEYFGKGESILVVDDVEEQRKIASIILNKIGYSVISVSSGEEAIEYMKYNSVDLLFLDMIMEPGIDGLETFKKIVEMHPGQRALIVSGFSATERVEEAQKFGAGQYIKKPYTLESIGLAVKAELSK